MAIKKEGRKEGAWKERKMEDEGGKKSTTEGEKMKKERKGKNKTKVFKCLDLVIKKDGRKGHGRGKDAWKR